MTMLDAQHSPYIRPAKAGRAKRRRWLGLTIAFLIVLALDFWAFYPGPVVRTYPVTSDKIPQGSVCIVQISDLHSHIYGSDQQPLIDLIAAQQPDIIALTGDILDDREPDTGTALLLKGIRDIAPVYYVSGNHEYWSGRYDDMRALLESCGVTVLDNRWEELSVNGVTLRLCGVDDPMMFEYTDDPQYLALSGGSENERDNTRALLDSRFSALDDSAFNVLLAHRAELIGLYLEYGFDLILSGHTHGGQIRIPPFINGLFAPNQGFFPQYGGGRYDFDSGQTLIISRGLSFAAYVPRVFNPPEVVVVDIRANV
ncbi:MAG: metallophosphoesterase [Christensenellaceae bacterium]|nr:metallophosphoesterase [Christensenellaceae bacterium]